MVCCWSTRGVRNSPLLSRRNAWQFRARPLSLHWLNNTRSYAELTILRDLKNSGVNVPAAIAAKMVRYGCIYQAEIITEKISCSIALVDLLVDQTLSAQIYYQIGAEIKKMHDAGVNHTDLNCHNILLQKRQTVWIIDFDKCYTQKGDKWKASNLDRLRRSFSKERVKRKIKFDDNDWESLIEAMKPSICLHFEIVPDVTV
ncbi:3-deoxy-D-manno-octulosonic acid kinase [Vibrio astriarenae]|nr:3-deoxy-D-manno-octulosonic acid kinase [Vibrio sp. C7]